MPDVKQATAAAVHAVLMAREFCGSESEAMLDTLADFGITRKSPVFGAICEQVRRGAAGTWADYQKAAGVFNPISDDERVTINKSLENQK